MLNLFLNQTSLDIYYPDFDNIRLICGSTAPDNDNITFCCAGAFTGSKLETFDHSNIAGNHISNGKLYKGYDCPINTGVFIWDNNCWKFLLGDLTLGLGESVNSNRMGFAQNMIIYNNVKQPLWRHNIRYYRSLCELNGKLCIIQSSRPMFYRTYVHKLEKLGVKHALYLDMGSWKHALYKTNNTIVHINESIHPYYTNWIVFENS